MRKILQLPTQGIPSDEQYHFRQRAQALVAKWQQLITTSEDNGNGTKATSSANKAGSASGRASAVGGKPKSGKGDDSAKDEDAPAEPEANPNGLHPNGSTSAQGESVDKS